MFPELHAGALALRASHRHAGSAGLVLSLLVAACGGGGGDSAAPPDGAATASAKQLVPASGGAATLAAAPAFNYAEALQKSIYFFEAQQSGKLPAWNRVTWRGDSRMGDGSDIGRDLTGGWYDAGDHVKFGFPMASSATQLAWGALRFEAGYKAAGQHQHLLNNLRFVNDYFLRAHTAPNELVVQVGNGGIDHGWWGPVEVYPREAPTYRITASCGGSDVAAETAAALAASHLVFKSVDPAYADRLLDHARQLYTFADNVRANYSDCVTDAAQFYKSWSGHVDELAWGAAWLHRATGEAAYLQKAEALVATAGSGFGTEGQSGLPPYKWTQSWDSKHYGVYILLAEATGKALYQQAIERNLDYWTTGTANGERVTYTPGGLAWLEQWGALRYAMNESFLALVYADGVADPVKQQRYRDFALRQLNYTLGDNPRQSSYVVGFGRNPPQHPHHRTSHGSWVDSQQTPAQHRHILYGALVGGPGANDSYTDDIGNFVTNEVATDYNAAFTGVLAKAMELAPGSLPLADFPPAEAVGEEMFVEAGVNASGSGFTEIRALLNNRSGWPARQGDKLSFRYYVDLAELLQAGGSASDVSLRSAYSEGGRVGALQRCGSSTLFYVVVDFSGTQIYPGGQSAHRKEVQFRFTAPVWQSANDPSSAGLSAGSVVKTSAMPVYDNGQRVSGVEPAACGGTAEPAPSAPGGLAAVAGEGSVTLSWSAGEGASAYTVERAGAAAGPFVAVASLGADARAHVDTGLSGGATYWYRVLSVNGGGQASSSVVAAQPTGQPASACKLSFNISNDWGAGQVMTVRLLNNGTAALNGWQIGWTASNDFSLGNAWNGVVSQSGRVLTAGPVSWNASIAPGSAAEFGVQLAYQGSRPIPTQGVVQGLACTVEVIGAP